MAMSNALSLRVLAIIYTFCHLARAELTVVPIDTEALVGSVVTFNCSTSIAGKGVQWFHYPVGSTEKDIIYGNDKLYPPDRTRLVVERIYASNSYNLVIPDLRIEDAGRYLCQDDEGQGQKGFAQLIVLTNSPVCKSNIDTFEVTGPNSCNIENETLTLSCDVSFAGNASPAMVWKRIGSPNAILTGVGCEYMPNSTTCRFSTKGDASINGASFVCHTTRARGTQYHCTSQNVKILYAFSNFSVQDKRLGDEVTCLANSSQSCRYRWIKDNAVKGSSNVTQLDEVGLYRCEADCPIKGKPCTVNAAIVHVSVPPAQAAANAGLIAVIVVLAIILIAFIVVFVVLQRMKSKRPDPANASGKDIALIPAENEAEKARLQVELQTAEDEIQRLKDTAAENAEQFDKEKKDMKTRQKELSKFLYQPRPDNVDYTLKMAGPITTKTTVREMRPIRGLAILDKELFIASDNSMEVEVYDSTTSKYNRGWALVDLVNAEDVAACSRNKCLYFSDKKKDNEEKELIRVDCNGVLVTKWSTGNVSGRLSVTDDATILFTVYKLNEVIEYLPEGQVIRKIKLTGLNNPLHAIKLKTGHFAVSHGMTDADIHRVCIVDNDGEVIKSFGKKAGSGIGQLNGPICLAVDTEGSIIVVDCNNSRLVLLNSILEFKRALDSPVFQYPVRVCLNQSNGRMFVADLQNANHRLTVFDLEKPGLPDPVKY